MVRSVLKMAKMFNMLGRAQRASERSERRERSAADVLKLSKFCFEFSYLSFCLKLVGHLGGLPCIRKVWIGSNRVYGDMVERSKYLQACVQCTSLPNIIALPVHLPRQVELQFGCQRIF